VRKRKINDNVKPFIKAKPHFANASFFEEDDAPKETMPSTVTFTGRGSTKNVIEVPKRDMPTHQLQKEESQ